MALILATEEDINLHLPADKAQITDGEAETLQIDAFRLIRARLASTFSIDILNGWTSPNLTPEIIRQVAGQLIAAKFYANLVAEDEADGSEFAQGLYNEAIATLDQIRSGHITVIDVDGDELDNTDLTQTSFYPNATADGPSFTIADVWS